MSSLKDVLICSINKNHTFIPMKDFVDYIKLYTDFSDEELQMLQEVTDRRTYKKGEIIFEEGNISEDIYFVTKGCIRLFYNADGTEKTAFFYTEGQFICAGESYTFGVPAIENYQAIEESEVYVFNKAVNDKLLEITPRFEILARIATENELIVCQKMIASFVMKSAEERYVELLQTQRELFQRVPQQYIASYLGVSPETLSRIKTRVFKKERS